eukprot:GHVT01048018.1.p1 GENE.GHVT01048018.1~~GHVT01048018.1.p1  ORF type:complete len:691 (-),score=51.38 GHVT01048018.1:519-2591(-)
MVGPSYSTDNFAGPWLFHLPLGAPKHTNAAMRKASLFGAAGGTASSGRSATNNTWPILTLEAHTLNETSDEKPMAPAFSNLSSDALPRISRTLLALPIYSPSGETTVKYGIRKSTSTRSGDVISPTLATLDGTEPGAKPQTICAILQVATYQHFHSKRDALGISDGRRESSLPLPQGLDRHSSTSSNNRSGRISIAAYDDGGLDYSLNQVGVHPQSSGLSPLGSTRTSVYPIGPAAGEKSQVFSHTEAASLQVLCSLAGSTIYQLQDLRATDYKRQRCLACFELASMLANCTCLLELDNVVRSKFSAFFGVQRVRLLFYDMHNDEFLLSPSQYMSEWQLRKPPKTSLGGPPEFGGILPDKRKVGSNMAQSSWTNRTSSRGENVGSEGDRVTANVGASTSTDRPSATRPMRLPTRRGITGQAVRERAVWHVGDLTEDPLLDPYVDGVARVGKSTQHPDGNMLVGPMFFDSAYRGESPFWETSPNAVTATSDLRGDPVGGAQAGDAGNRSTRGFGDLSPRTSGADMKMPQPGKQSFMCEGGRRGKLVGVIQLINKRRSTSFSGISSTNSKDQTENDDEEAPKVAPISDKRKTIRNSIALAMLDASTIANDTALLGSETSGASNENVPFIHSDVELFGNLLKVCAGVAYRLHELAYAAAQARGMAFELARVLSGPEQYHRKNKTPSASTHLAK